jgi:vancomycin permeability regulator SanA
MLSRLFVILHYQVHITDALIYTVDNAPTKQVAIVFGAGLRWDGTPTHVLQDRIDTAVRLYQEAKVSKLLMSGDNRTVYYNEPEAMRDYALRLGVPYEDIILDYAGLRTYDTCYRAKNIFHVEEAALITQKFHLPRALYLCNELGIRAVGVEAQGHRYSRSLSTYWDVREAVASLVAIWEVKVTKPKPILGRSEPISLSRKGEACVQELQFP